MSVIKEHMLMLFKNNIRLDGRKFEEYRNISVETDVSNSAEGSARVRIGETEVVAGVKMEIGKPYPDTPNEGSIMVNVELRPLASPNFVLGPPGFDAIELARVTDRALREAEAIDLKKLCIKEGEAMWLVVIDIYPINDAGNLFDASALAALAALKNTKFPKLEEENKINYKEKTDKKLPLSKTNPISCTVRKIGNNLIIDPSDSEEEFVDARLTVGVTESGDICSMQKGGNIPLSMTELEKCVDIAIKKTHEIRKVLK